MSSLEQRPIDPHRGERRERIATAVLASLVASAGEFLPEQSGAAVRAANALIEALDAETVDPPR